MGLTSSQAGAMNDHATKSIVQYAVLLVLGIVLAVRPFVALVATPLWSAPFRGSLVRVVTSYYRCFCGQERQTRLFDDYLRCMCICYLHVVFYRPFWIYS